VSVWDLFLKLNLLQVKYQALQNKTIRIFLSASPFSYHIYMKFSCFPAIRDYGALCTNVNYREIGI